MSDYQVVMDSAVVDVTIGDGAEMQVEQALQYVKSGQKEIDSYVAGVSKPALDEYVVKEKEPELDAYCRVKEQEIDTYVDEVSKPALDEYVAQEKEPEIAAYVENTIKPDVRAFAEARTEEFDANAADKQALVDAKALEAANSAAAALQSEKNAAASMIAAAASAQSAAGAMSAAQISETNAKASENRCEDIFERLGTVIKIKGRVDTFEELPTIGNLDGDAYLVGVAGLTSYPEYYWFSDHWEYLGTSTDKIEWGTLQGNIAKQADLQQALDEKQNCIADLDNIRLGAGKGATALQSFTEKDPTVPAHVKSITQANIDTWNNKQATITGAASSITSSNLTANMALRTDDNGKITNSSATSTELSYLSGVTSAVQTQLDGKQAKGSYANTDLSNVTNVSSVFKENSAGWGIPDYSAGITITSGYIANRKGLATVSMNGADHVTNSVYINGIKIGHSAATNAYQEASVNAQISLDVGDKISWGGTSQVIAMFFPYKGV